MKFCCEIILIITIISSKFNTASAFVNTNLTFPQNKSEQQTLVNSVCGDVYTQKQFVLESKGWPNNYQANADCTYLIKGPQCPTSFTFEFVDFDLETSSGCTKDRLEVDNLDALCGNKQGSKTYFSPNGALQVRFRSDSSSHGRGFKILVTRSACRSSDPNDETDQFTTVTTRKPKSLTTVATTFNKNLRQCCSNNFSGKRVLVTSPNFPYSLNTAADCTIEIRKNNQNICRLRIHVLFFFMGASINTNCDQGFLQIDGKYICGCKSELKIISSFRNEDFKLLQFRSNGYRSNSYSGFVLEVIQDECPKRYSPEEGVNSTIQIAKNGSKEFRFYNDQVNKVVWPNDTQKSFVEKLKLIKEKTEILDDNDENFYNTKIVKHVYFFADPSYDTPYVPFQPKEREETTYIDTSTINNLAPDLHDFDQCLNWNQIQFNLLYARFGQNLPKCQTNQDTSLKKKCVELDYVKGYFVSPGYPLFYPGNLDICYRFRKQSGFCLIRVHIKDFQIENSANCLKDYLLIGNQYRYCGSSLHNAVTTIDLRKRDYEEVRFVTDAYYCGKGFLGVYEQIACQDMTYPINPVNPSPPPHPHPHPPPPATQRPVLSCDMVVRERTFTLDVHSYSSQKCQFEIKKSSPNVCKLELVFEKFDLTCNIESLFITGDRMYCGQQTGRKVILDIPDTGNSIIYRKTNSNIFNQGLRLRIRGRQIEDDCLYNEVPPERLILNRKSSFADTSKLTLSDLKSQNDTKYLIAMVDRNFKDICGIITNTTEQNIPETFCDILMENKNATKCLPIKENSLYVPYGSKKLELKIKDVETIDEIEYQEIDCEDLNNLNH